MHPFKLETSVLFTLTPSSPLSSPLSLPTVTWALEVSRVRLLTSTLFVKIVTQEEVMRGDSTVTAPYPVSVSSVNSPHCCQSLLPSNLSSKIINTLKHPELPGVSVHTSYLTAHHSLHLVPPTTHPSSGPYWQRRSRTVLSRMLSLFSFLHLEILNSDLKTQTYHHLPPRILEWTASLLHPPLPILWLHSKHVLCWSNPYALTTVPARARLVLLVYVP